MFRGLLFLLGAAIVGGFALYLYTGRQAYLTWARRAFFTALAAGVLFFTVLLIKRLI